MRKSSTKQLAIVMAALMLFTTGVPSPAKAETASSPYEKLDSVFTTDSIVVDGLADAAYSNAPVSYIDNAKDGTKSEDFHSVSGGAISTSGGAISTSGGAVSTSGGSISVSGGGITGNPMRSVWDGETLYLLIDVDDTTPAYETTPGVTSARSAGGLDWVTWQTLPNTYSNEDGVEFSVDFWNDKGGKFEDDDGLFTVTRAGALTYQVDSGVINHSSAYVQEANREYTNRIKGYAVKERADGSGYTVELALQIYGAKLDNGTKFGIDVMLGDSPSNSTPRTKRTYWSHNLNSLPFSTKDYNSDWGEITLTGWNGTDEFAFNDWKLTNQIRFIDSVSFVKGVWTPETQKELDEALALARDTVGSTSQAEIDAAAARLKAAVDGLRWADTKYPDPMDLPSELTLPNIYEFFDGTKVKSLSDWNARRNEILDLAQFYEYGYKPASPDSISIGAITYKPATTSPWFGTTPAYYEIPVDVTYKEVTKTIKYKLSLPSEEQRVASGHEGVAVPVMLSFGAGSTDYHNAGIATLEIPTDVTTDDRNDPWINKANGGNRAGTLRSFFPYTRDGDTNEISNEMLAALGASIGIDALELLVKDNMAIADQGNAADLISASDLAVTGFSINGKYAFVSAVFDNRIDICVPGAAGVTGPATYRFDMNRTTAGNIYSWGIMGGGEVMGDTIRHNPGRTTELFRRFLTPGRFYYKVPGSYGYGDRLPYDHEELVASLALSPSADSNKPRAIVLQHTIDDNGNQSQGDALSLEIAKTVYTWLGYDADEYVKFCFRNSGGHGTDSTQNKQIAEYVNWYFTGSQITEDTATNLNRDPFYDDVIDGVDGWTRNYGGYEAVAPWINSMKPSITSFKVTNDSNTCNVTVEGSNLQDTARGVTLYVDQAVAAEATLQSAASENVWNASLTLPSGSLKGKTVKVVLDMANNYNIDLNQEQIVEIKATPTPTPTSTPAPTATPSPTNTPVPTNTPAPTNTPVPTTQPTPTTKPTPTATITSAPVKEETPAIDKVPANSTAIQLDVTRTTDTNGAKKDLVELSESKAAESVKNALSTKSSSATIYIPDKKGDNADVVEVKLPNKAATELGQNNLALNIVTDKVSLALPSKTLTEAKDKDLSIHVSEVKDNKEIESTKALMLQMSSGAQMLGSPVSIETNYALETQVTIPITSSYIPTGKDEMKDFIRSLAILVEHSDGENRVQKGTIVYNKDGVPVGVSIYVDKFSTFSLVKTTFKGTETKLSGKQMPDKELILSFSKTIDKASVTEDSVYVLDSKGNKVEVTLKATDKNISIKPVSNYSPNETYTAYITQNVRYSTGKAIEKPKKYEFTIGSISLNGKKIKEYTNISADKVWSINLKQAIDTNAFKSSYVTVVDQACNKVKVKATVTKDSYLQVKADAPYKKGQTYYIVISGVKFKDGKKMDKAQYIKFTISK